MSATSTAPTTASPISPSASRYSVSSPGCSGPWLEVEIHQPNAKTVSRKPASTADGTTRLDRRRSCTKQRDGPCTGVQVRLSLVAAAGRGVTECQVGAVINDPDPAGLNVRDAPGKATLVSSAVCHPHWQGHCRAVGPDATSNFTSSVRENPSDWLPQGLIPDRDGGQGAPTTTPICRRQSPTAVAAGSRRAC